jgi:Zn-finger protein
MLQGDGNTIKDLTNCLLIHNQNISRKESRVLTRCNIIRHYLFFIGIKDSLWYML